MNDRPNDTRRTPTVLAAIFAAFAMIATSCTDSSVTALGCDPSEGPCFCVAEDVTAPTIDGILVGDPGWAGALTLTRDLGSGPDIVFQATADADNLYLAVQTTSVPVLGGPDYSAQDVIVLGFDPDSDPATDTAADRRLQIFPVNGGGSKVDGTPESIEYWEGSVPDWNTVPAVLPAAYPNWLGTDVANHIQVTSQILGSDVHWYTEIKIPFDAANGIATDAASGFGFYLNVFKHVGAGATEWPWPNGVNLVSFFNTTWMPPVSDFGNVFVATGLCNGVAITSSDISAGQSPASAISTNMANYFSADPRNSSIDSGGAFTVAEDVTATFEIANWGIPTLTAWGAIPATGGNQVTADLPAGDTPPATPPLALGEWLLDATEQGQYAPPNDHQCVRVTLSTTNSDTNLLTPTAQRNMDFQLTTSPFDRTAQIGTEGYADIVKTGELRFLLTTSGYNTPPELEWREDIGIPQLDANLYELVTSPERPVDFDQRIAPPDIELPIKRFIAPTVEEPLVVAVSAGNLITVFGPSPALSGSWDGGETVFAVGRGKTLKVPRGVNELTLVMNAEVFEKTGGLPTIEQRGDVDATEVARALVGGETVVQVAERFGGGAEAVRQIADALLVETIETPAESYFAGRDGIVGRELAPGERVELGANLPKWAMCGYLDTGEVWNVQGVEVRRLVAVGCFGYAIRSNSG